MNQVIKPFLKWAGGKRWLVEKELSLFPQTYNRYIEPFLGGGAVFFAEQPKRAIISDLNQDLISTYVALADNWKAVERLLGCHQKRHSDSFYYSMRETDFATPAEAAARFIYLNRTCWNGLYRVNLNGKFNVPKGTKDKILLGDDFEKISEILRGVDIRCCDFEETLALAGERDFVFVDPPYTVHHNMNGFIKYNKKLFSWEDQVRLREAVLKAVKRGAYVIVTNAAHASVCDLYEDFADIIQMDRNSSISGKASTRGKKSEVLIKCF